MEQQITSPHLLRAKELLRCSQYKEALSVLSDIDTAHLSQGEKALHCLLLAKAKLNLGHYDIDDVLNEALQYYRHSQDDEEYASAKYLQGWLLIARGRHFEAREILLESYLIYKRKENIAEQARVLNRLSLLCVQLGEIDTAIEYAEKCIALYDGLKDNYRKITVLANLASLCYASGHILRSIELYEQIEFPIRELNDKRNISVYYFQSAVAYALKGDIKIAQLTIKKAVPYLDDFVREQAIYQENLGWIHLLEENYTAAEKALLEGLKISMEIAPESALISQIKRRLGDAYLGLGRYDLAKKYTDEGLIVAEKINERVEIAACYRVYAQLDAINGREDKAREWFKKAIDIFAMIGSRYEVAATRYLAAISGLYQNGEKQALLYLAREYFVSEEVTPYIEKIDRQINQVPVTCAPAVKCDGEPPVIIAVNPAMKEVLELARNVARSEMSILLTGPTGSGKDLLARYIHYHSGCAGRFVSVNTAAIPDNMVESELFGYRKGAFTGADREKIGLVEEADGGTLYLNEIADALPALQAKLLDVLENRTLRRLGETKERKVAFRLIAATNHDLEKSVRDGKFRPDLYHRLREVPIELPALAKRKDDVKALVVHFLTECGINASTNGNGETIARLQHALAAQCWPGNVRELRAAIRRLFVISQGNLEAILEMAEEQAGAGHLEKQLTDVLTQCNGNKTRAADLLGISEATVRYRLKKNGSA